jgi:hypothetical protein
VYSPRTGLSGQWVTKAERRRGQRASLVSDPNDSLREVYRPFSVLYLESALLAVGEVR